MGEVINFVIYEVWGLYWLDVDIYIIYNIFKKDSHTCLVTYLVVSLFSQSLSPHPQFPVTCLSNICLFIFRSMGR
jgi:hypothetical protein